MKIFTSALFSVFIVLFLYSCSKSPDELIVGKWKYDHMNFDDGDGSTIGDDLAVMLAEKQLKDITMEFFEDSTRVTIENSSGKKAHDRYWLESKNTYLCTQTEKDSEIKRTEIRITEDTLVMMDTKGEIFLVRVTGK